MTTAFAAGPFECLLIAYGRGFLPPDVVFQNAPADDRAAALGDRLGPEGIATPYGCLLARGAGEVVLVDTGIGGYEHPLGGSGGELDSALAAAGVAPPDVGVVVITHGHVDHIGGLCVEGRPRFANARHVISREEWDWVFEDADTSDFEQLLPLEESGLLEFVDGPVDLVAGIRLLSAPGHTPGQLVVEIGPPGGAIYLADVVIDEAHVEHPDWLMAFDTDGEQNVETRRALLGRAADEERTIGAAHIPTLGRVERADGGFGFVPLA